MAENSGLSIDRPQSADEAAEEVGIGVATVNRAKRLRREASPEVIKAVEAGEMTVNAALKTIGVGSPPEDPGYSRSPRRHSPDQLVEKAVVGLGAYVEGIQLQWARADHGKWVPVLREVRASISKLINNGVKKNDRQEK